MGRFIEEAVPVVDTKETQIVPLFSVIWTQRGEESS